MQMSFEMTMPSGKEKFMPWVAVSEHPGRCKGDADDVPPFHQRRSSRICTLLDFLQSSNRGAERNQKHSFGLRILSDCAVFRTHHVSNICEWRGSRAVGSGGYRQFATHIAGDFICQRL